METTSTHRGSSKGDSKEGQERRPTDRHGEESNPTVEVIEDAAREVRAHLASAIEAGKATCSKLQDTGVECVRATDKMVRKHPYPSLGLAFGIGALIGFLYRRRS